MLGKTEFDRENQSLEVEIVSAVDVPALLNEPVLELVQWEIAENYISKPVSNSAATEHAGTPQHCTLKREGDAEAVQ
jgi:hypothetical protein